MKNQYLKSIFLLGILCTVLSCGENARQTDGLSDKTHIINIPEDLSNISHLDSVFSDGEQLIMPIEASWLQIELTRISPEYINKLNIGYYKNMDEFNNPILVLYKLKK